MNLITTGSIGKALGTDKPSFEKLNGYILKTLKLNQINQLYASNYSESGIDFIERILSDLNIKLEISEEEIKHIPLQGPFISVSNHPFGAIDGLILILLISKKRPDFKAMANFLLEMVDPLKDYIIPVNPFETKKLVKNNLEGVRQSMRYLKSGHPVGIFPAGEVSSLQNFNQVTDKPWNHSVVKFIKKSKVPVLPIYFHGQNSIAFHILGLINPNFRTAKLGSELLNKKNKTITVRIGNIIDLKQQNTFATTEDFGKYLRAKTYALGTKLDVNTFYKYNRPYLKLQKKLIPQINKALLKADLTQLPANNLLFTWGDYKVYHTTTAQIPNVINEIGRLREKTFRSVEEGTGKPLDVDAYDLYYDQLFIWDGKCEKIVGGYRIGMGQKIMENFGKRGFYLNTLFKFNKKLAPVLNQSIELGRSFVTEDYQKKAFPLFCLWKGILQVLLSKPEYRYLIGPVTISSAYSKLSKNLIIDFIQNNHYNHQVSQLVKPRKKHKVKYKNEEYNLLMHSYSSINILDKIIEDIEIGKFKVPILFKKYLQQNAQIIGFNRDPKFNDALDGLMMLDVSHIPAKTLRSLSNSHEEFHHISERFYGQYHNTFQKVPQF